MWPRSACAIFKAAMAAVAFLVFVALVLMSTASGQRWLLDVAGRLSSDQGSRITIRGLEGSLFSSGRIARVEVADANGAWLVVRNITFSWQPLRLLRGILDIEGLEVGSVALERLPVGGSRPSTGEAGAAFEMPLGLELRQGTIREIRIAQPVVGVEARLAAATHLSLAGRDASASLNVRRIDSRKGTLSATLAYRAATGKVDLAVEAAEPAGGLVAAALDSPGRPPLRATLTARGTLKDLHADLRLVSHDKPITIGRGRLWRDGDERRLSLALEGFLAPVVPGDLRGLLADRTKLRLEGRYAAGNRFSVEKLSVSSGAMTVRGRGGLDLARGSLFGAASLKIGRADGRAVRLPRPGDASLAVRAAAVELSLGEPASDDPLDLSAVVEGIEATGHARVDRMMIEARALQSFGRDGPEFDDLKIGVEAFQITLGSPEKQAPSLAQFVFEARGRASRSAVTLEAFNGAGAGIELSGHGRIAAGRLEAEAAARLADLSVLSGLIEWPLGGRARFEATGRADLSAGTGEATVRLGLEDVRLGEPRADLLLRGAHVLEAQLLFDGPHRIVVPMVAISGETIAGTGRIDVSKWMPSIHFDAVIKELGRLDGALDGRLAVTGELAATPVATTSRIDVRAQSVTLHGQPVSRFVLSARGRRSLGALRAEVSFEGEIEGTDGAGRVRLAQEDQTALRFEDIAVRLGSNQLAGRLEIGGPKGPTGALSLNAPALDVVSKLLGQRVTGRLKATLAPDRRWPPGGLALTAVGEGITYETINLDHVRLDAAAGDILNDPFGEVRLKVSRAKVGTHTISSVSATLVANPGEAARYRIAAQSDILSLKAGGRLEKRSRGAVISLEHAELRAGDVISALAMPARVTVSDAGIAAPKMTFSAGAGRLTIAADTVDKLDVTAEFVRLPLSLADHIRADLGARGEINGRLSVQGSVAKPVLSLNAQIDGASVAISRKAGLAPVAVRAVADASDGTTTLTVTAQGRDGLSTSLRGKILDRAGRKLALRVEGKVPLSLLNALLADRGTRGEGLMAIEGTVDGSITDPLVAGKAVIRDAEIVDPASGLKLTKVAADARISSQELVVDRLVAQALPGGDVRASGRLEFAPDSGYPVSADVRAEGLRLESHSTMTGSLDAALTLSGALEQRLQLAGDIALKRFDVLIPEAPPRTVRELEIKHVNVPEPRKKELVGNSGGARAPSATIPIGLDIQIRSNDMIFIRGRGLEAQLGGALRLVGEARSPTASGEFRMLRGQFALLRRRLDFNSGTIGFAGSIDPALDFEATTTVEGTVITTRVTGRASEPRIAFSSSPELPEDEIMARLLFDRSIAKLSPLQLAQLATAVDRLGGFTGGSGILDQLRRTVGIDALDVGTDKRGNATVSAGTYISSGAYLGVEQNTQTTDNRVIIDLDITRHIKARGETGSKGDSRVGVGIEWNY